MKDFDDKDIDFEAANTLLCDGQEIVSVRADGSAVWDQEGMRRIERALSTGSGTMFRDAFEAAEARSRRN